MAHGKTEGETMMGVYVDSCGHSFGRMKMCHMIADSRIELIAMAEMIGVEVGWIQAAGTPTEHFDVCMSKRKLAIGYGAQPINRRKLAILISGKRTHGGGK